MRPALPDPLDDAADPPARRAVCPRCGRPRRTCLCAWVRPTGNTVPLLILQHPMESRQAKGSARLLQLSLQHCRCEVGERFDDAALAGWLATPWDGGAATGPFTTLLLYPDDSAGRPVPAALRAPGDNGAPAAAMPAAGTALRLVLLDGTWRQARRLLQTHPRLQALPRWPLPLPPPSRYAIRKAHRSEQRSTLEAACLALGALEDTPARYAPLLAAFDGWVASLAHWRPTPGGLS